MDFLSGASLVSAAVTMGLFAGLFYTFSCAVMPGLRRTDDRTFVAAMRGINVAILNGWFALSFAGAGLLAAAAAVLHIGEAPLPWTVAAFVLYAAVVVITFAVNVPLNNALNAAGVPDDAAALAAVRERFEAGWVRWNLVRAVVSTGALGCLAMALRAI